MQNTIRAWAEKLRYPGLLIFALGVCAGLFVTFVIWPHQHAVISSDDPYGFSALGESIMEGRGFAQWKHPELLTMRRAPLYPAIIALLYTVGGVHTNLVRLLQCIVSGGTAALTFAIGRRVFSLPVGLLAGVLCAFHPMVVRYVPDVQVECLLTFFTTLMVWCGLRFIDKPTLATGAALGATGALGALVKGVLVICPPIFALCWLVRQLKRGEPLRFGAVAAIAAAMCVVILPWTARNYRVSGGHFVLISTNAGGEFLRGYVFAQPRYYLLRDKPYAVGENEANQMEINLFKSKNLVWERDETETEQVLGRAAKEKFFAEPVAFARKFVIGIFTFWYVLTTKLNSLAVGTMALVSWVLALIGWRRARAENRALWPLLQPILTINLLYAVMLSLGRYSAPTIPTLMVLTSWGLVSLLDRKPAAPAAP